MFVVVHSERKNTPSDACVRASETPRRGASVRGSRGDGRGARPGESERSRGILPRRRLPYLFERVRCALWLEPMRVAFSVSRVFSSHKGWERRHAGTRERVLARIRGFRIGSSRPWFLIDVIDESRSESKPNSIGVAGRLFFSSDREARATVRASAEANDARRFALPTRSSRRNRLFTR